MPGANKMSEEDIKRAAESRAPRPDAERGPAAWKRVCARADVPANGMKQFSVDGVDVLMVNAGDAFVACQAICPHEAVPLEEGVHDGSTLTCMEHMWQFDLKTGAPLGDAQEGLKEYRLKEEHGDLYIALEG
jgi:toluene monooxygenase system ferredoxin subunit